VKRNPIHKVDTGTWVTSIDTHRSRLVKSWGFTCPQCGQEFKRPVFTWNNSPVYGSPWMSRKQAKDVLNAHLSGKGTRIVCKGGQVETATG
jgi:hypothetical protein